MPGTHDATHSIELKEARPVGDSLSAFGAALGLVRRVDSAGWVYPGEPDAAIG